MNTKQINNQGKANLYFAVIVIAILFTCCSCGSRKVEKSKSVVTEKQLQIDTSKTVTKIDSNIKVTDLGTIEEITIIPFDSTKEMVINNIVYKNVKLAIKKTKANKVVEQSKTASQIEQKAVKISNNKVATVEQKATERKSNYYWLLWLLLIIPIWWVWKRYKALIFQV